MKRRSFLKSSAILGSPLVLGGVPVAAISENLFSSFLNEDSDRVLVLIQLGGGNDGLNCIIPKDAYDNLVIARPQVIIPENEILDVTDTIGFHPSMAPMKELYNEGQLSIIQGVGYANQNRSHFRSTDIWHTASDADAYLSTGWLGRYMDAFNPDYPANYPNSDCPDPFALTIGSSVSETCQGTAGNFSLALVDPENLSQLSTPINNDIEGGCYADKLDFLAKTIEQTNAYGSVIQDANDLGMNASTLYNENDSLSQKLKLVAKLIKGGLRTKIYVVNLGGFDTHANQVVEGESTTGEHAELLRELSEAIYAFQDDLKTMGLEKRVAGMTYSEFGRRIKSNFSFGTDHGSAAPLLVFGSCVLPTIHGDNAEISDNVDIQEGVALQYDFRSVYGSMLIDWFDVEENVVQDILLGEFQKIALIDACESPNSTTKNEIINDLQIYPNPIRTDAVLEFESEGSDTKISIFDTLGSEVKVIMNRSLPAGHHTIKLSMSELTAGAYFVRVLTKTGQKTKRVVKV